MSHGDWLPALALLSDHGGVWQRYVEALFDIYLGDFVRHNPVFSGKIVKVKRHPERDGKGATFWHLITAGSVEEKRAPDECRCERIRWPRPIIECSERARVCLWIEKRDDGNRALLALPDFSYVVVLVERGTFYLLITAYCVEREHRRNKLEKQYLAYKNGAGLAP